MKPPEMLKAILRARPALATIDGRDWPEPVGPDVSAHEFAFVRGWRDYRAGKPCPPRPSDDDPMTGVETSEWLGWMMGRADVIRARVKAREMLGIKDVELHCTLLPGPPDEPA